MNAEQKDRWKKIRQKGEFRFVSGAFFSYGLGGASISTPIDYSFELFFDDVPNYLHESDRFHFKILFRLVGFSLIGFYINYSLWNENEDDFFPNSEEE